MLSGGIGGKARKIMGSLSRRHVLIFPFMSQGHTIPLLYLARLLSRRSASVTVVTTPGNVSVVRAAVEDVDVSVVEIPFPRDVEGVPPGVENTDKLSHMISFFPFLQATKRMRESFDQVLENVQPPVSCIISDMFLGWTLASAEKVGVPRITFCGMGNFSFTMYENLMKFRPQAGTDSGDEPFPMTDFPNVYLTRNDFSPPFNEIEIPSNPYVDFMMECKTAMNRSYGLIVNSFYELESCYIDYLKTNFSPKTWNIGPLCLAAGPIGSQPKPGYVKWLDEKTEEGEPVLYVSFGTQAEVSAQQHLEIANGLEKSGVSFLWALKSGGLDFLPSFESRVKNRGLVVRDWVDQLTILRHEGVKGFLSHCGWNSIMESVSSRVPILALPFMAEQHMNARFVVDQIGVGLRIVPPGGSMMGDVEESEVESKVRELMGGEKAVDLRRKVAQFGDAACAAMEDAGSSISDMESFLDSTCQK